MVRRGVIVGLGLVLLSSTAGAEEPRSTAREAPYVPRLELTWPLAPERLTFDIGMPVVSADGELRPYRIEATWLRAGPLTLQTFQRVEPSFELDCRLLCQPMLERSIGAELQLHLGGSEVVPDAYLFARSALVVTPLRTFHRLQAGFGGQLDL